MARAARSVDDGDGPLLAGSLFGRRFHAVLRRWRCRFVRWFRWDQRNPRGRLASQRIVVEDRKAREDRQKQAQRPGKHLHRGERQPKPPRPRRFPSKRCTQIVGRIRFRHQSSRINRTDDTTAGQRCGRSRASRQGGRSPQMEQAKGRERLKAAPWQRFYPAGLDQFAALLAGLSIAALSLVAGAGVEALDLMPCSRSSAILSALSSLTSSGI